MFHYTYKCTNCKNIHKETIIEKLELRHTKYCSMCCKQTVLIDMLDLHPEERKIDIGMIGDNL